MSIRGSLLSGKLTYFGGYHPVWSFTLAIEKGRHTKPRTNISDRLCLYCSNNTIEDEKHFVVQCPFYSEERKQLFKKVHSINPSFVHMSDDEKFVYLFCSNDERILAWFGKFIHISLSKRVVLSVTCTYIPQMYSRVEIESLSEFLWYENLKCFICISLCVLLLISF